MTATIFEAKTKLSELLKRAQAGEQVVITSGREKTPVAELKAISPRRPKRLGCLEGMMDDVSKSFFEPLPNAWAGLGDDPDDSMSWSQDRIYEVNALANENWNEELALITKSSQK